MLRRIVSPCAPFAASRLVDTMRLLFILKWHSSLREGKSLDRHMAAFSILKWQNSLQEGKSSLQNTTRSFPYIRKWHSSLQEGKSFSRYNAASFYHKMAKLTSEGKSLDRHMTASSILKWQYLTKLDKSIKINIIVV